MALCEAVVFSLKFSTHSLVLPRAQGGTCAMAAPESTGPLSAVDSECQVYGVQGLRVVGQFLASELQFILPSYDPAPDTSVFPVPISANTQAPTYALAEKIAELILKKHTT